MTEVIGQCNTKKPVYGGIIEKIGWLKILNRIVFQTDLKAWRLATIRIFYKGVGN